MRDASRASAINHHVRITQQVQPGRTVRRVTIIAASTVSPPSRSLYISPRPFHALVGMALLTGAVLTCAAKDAAFHFEVPEGQNINYFLRDGAVAAHLLLRSGSAPRVLVAFPAGNSGVGLWFEAEQSAAPQWVINSAPAAKIERDARGRTLYGITFEASVAVHSLVPKQAVLSSIRVLRDYQSLGTIPVEVATRAQVVGKTVTWSRDRLDGAPGYRLSLQVTDGAVAADGRISAGADGQIKLRVTALSGEQPLTALAGQALLRTTQVADERAADTLTYLSYQEKFLAGSWRFDTYFGRDTLMSLRLLMPALAPQAIEAGLRSVLARLSDDGQVAHEEGIGEFAVLAHKKESGTLSDRPIFDYAMIDGNYLLAPVLVSYLLDDPVGRSRAASFLRSDATLSGGTRISAGQALIRNLRLLVTNTARFSSDPRYNNLISLKPGRKTGQWRDSEDGIGDGRYPYDVNAVLVPAALEATSRLVSAGLLDPFIAPADRKLFDTAGAAAKVWRERAPGLFDTTVDAGHARNAIETYASQIGVSAAAALSSVGNSPVSFYAISLDAAGKPVPIIHSDETAALLFGTPEPAALDRAVQTVVRPFPLGLLTDAGMVVANPVFADDALKAKFTNHAYHGTVIWSWQQAQFASGIERQLARKDLPPAVREHLLAAQQSLWHAIGAARSMQSSELWSWSFAGGRYHVAAFGASGADADESNAAQLWSSVYLAVRPPAR
jgi:glycogen debranching enzyme